MVAPILLAAGSFAAGMGMNPISAFLEPYSNGIKNWSYQHKKTMIPPAMDLILAHRRGGITTDKYKEQMGGLGYTDDMITALETSTENLPDLGILINAYLTNRLDSSTFRDYLLKLGWDDTNISNLKTYIQPYPSLQDFLAFMVKEAFTPEAVRVLQSDEGFNEVYEEAKKHLDVSEDVLKWYWRAHWQLPSPQMGFEFRHRLDPEVLGVIGSKYTEQGLNPNKLAFKGDDLDKLLKYQDFMPAYRDRIKAIAFQPLTRVDLRRIYGLGLISRSELIARFRELGYSKADSGLMANFYDVYTADKDKTLAKGEILALYTDNLISIEDTKNMLGELGYSPEESDYIIALIDHKLARQQLKDDILAIKESFIKGDISPNGAKGWLQDLGLSSRSVTHYLTDFQRAKNKAIKQPSKADVDRWLLKGLITPTDYSNRLDGLGYRPEDIALYKRELGV